MPTASARKNGTFGFKAVIAYEGGRTRVPHSKNWPTRAGAIAYAQKTIDAQAAYDALTPDQKRVAGQERSNARADAFIAAWNKAAA